MGLFQELGHRGSPGDHREEKTPAFVVDTAARKEPRNCLGAKFRDTHLEVKETLLG